MFKQRTAQSNYKRLQESARMHRDAEQAALSSQPGGLQWALGTQEYWHQDAVNDASKNDRHQIDDWLGAMAHHKQGVDQAYAATQSLIQSIPKVASWIEGERKASQETQFNKDQRDAETANAKIQPSLVRQNFHYENIGLSKEKTKTLKKVLPPSPTEDTPEITPQKEEEHRNNVKDGERELINEQVEKSGIAALANQDPNPVRAAETSLTLLDPTKGKYYNRAAIKHALKNSDSLFNQWISNADKDAKIQIKGQDGKYQEVPLKGFLDNPIHETSTSPYKQALNYWINNVLGPTALEALGKDYFSKNVIPILNKSYNTIRQEYEKNWVTNAHQTGLREAKGDYMDILDNIDQGGNSVELYKQISPMILDRISYHSKGLKMDGHKKDAINAFEQIVKTGALLNASQDKDTGTSHVPEFLIRASDVPWVGKKHWIKGADGINRVKLGVAHPAKFSEVAMQKLENDIIGNKITLAEELDKNRATDAVSKHIKYFTNLPSDYPNRKEMEQNSIIRIINQFPNQKAITDKLLDAETLKKSAQQSLGVLNTKLNSISGTKLTAKDYATAHPEAIAKLLKQKELTDKYDPSIYEAKPLMAQFSEDQIKQVISLGEAGIDDNNKAWDIQKKDTGETQIIKNWVSENLVEKFIRAEVADLRQAAESTGGTFILDERTLEKIATGAGTKLYNRIIRDRDAQPPGMFTVDPGKGMSENFHKARGTIYGDYTQREIDANRGNIMKRALEEYGGRTRLTNDNDIINRPLTNIDKTRFELTPEGNLDSLWYQLERDRTINPEGKSALEIYKAWGPANGVDDLEDPVDWSESAKVLEKNNISVEEVKPILNNQNALNRKIDENSVGAVSTGTIVNSITNTLGSSHKHSITSRRGFTEKWNGELVPAAMRLAVTHKLPNGAIIPIAMAMYFQKHNLITEDGQVLVYNDPQIKQILASIKNGGLD